MTTRSHSIPLAEPPEPTDHSLGPEHARVVLVEYGDFQSQACRQAAPIVRRLLDRFPNQIRFIYRHFPSEALHPQALLAAEAAEAAAAQGRFWPMHDLLFAHQAHLTAKDLQRHAESLGLDMARYAVEMDDRIYLQKVREHLDGGRRSHVRASPAFFLGGAAQDLAGRDLAAGLLELEEHLARAVRHAYP